MANPVYPVNCAKGQYTLIATDITSISVYRQKTDTQYLYTYRNTGDIAPTLREEAVRLFSENLDYEEISKQSYVDVYVWCDNKDGVLLVGEGVSKPIPSIVPGSSVVSEITVELVKKGFMYTLQTVFQGLTQGGTTDILIDPTLFTGRFGVLYDIKFSVTQGKANAQFYAGGTYSVGTPIYIANRNENSLNVATTVISSAPTVSVLGTGGHKYVAGGEAQGNNLAGGSGGDSGFPTEINTAIKRLLRIVHTSAGGAGTYDLELRIVFAEII